MQQASTSFIVSRLRVGLGTFVALEAEADRSDAAEAGVGAAFQAIARVENLMHPTRGGSDLARIHGGVLGMPLTVHAWTWELLALCKRLNHLSHGLFDPCLPDSAGRFASLDLMAPSFVIPRARLQLDLGGIAKGFAVDRAIDAVRASGCDGGLVNAGGDVAVFGDRAHEIVTWGRRGVASVTLRNAALAASDACNRSRPSEHQGYYHGVDGRATPAGRATVMAPTAAVADGLTTCLSVGESRESDLLLNAFSAQRVD